MPRASSPLDRNGLKTAVKRLVADLGGVEAAATCTRVGKSQMSEYGAIQAEGAHIPVDVALDLEIIAGVPLITEALARAQGYLLVPVALPGEGDVARALQVVASDAGATLSDAMRALSGGMTPEELIILQADLHELSRAASLALSAVNRKMGRSPPPVVQEQPA